MRADRLLSLLMLIQSRGQMTAQELADELEVSERTIYRDITALSASGVPIYASRGPGGGVRLIEEYRTTLTGLTSDETRALFTMSIPAPLMQLGMGEKFKGALLKLSAALPDTRRADEARTRQRILLDSSWWFQTGQQVPCLQIIQQALFQDRCLRIKVRWDFFNTEFGQDTEPYGLVAKANIWYLVYARGGSPHVARVSQIMEAELMAGTFTRPPDFDLEHFWESWCREYESQPPFRARVRVAPQALPILAEYVGDRARMQLNQSPRPDQDGWVTLDLPFESFVAARTRLLGLGRAVEVLEPISLRKSLIDFAEQIVGFYKNM
ncbi:MAG TPA: WYL domain-containing protein [Anaerolineales bacterium]|nr:WYL domain-containing protein [Anaerolineales bacterium]